MVTASHCVGISSDHETATGIHSYTTNQTPERIPAGYNPNRIPASVFSNKPTNQTEWSIASTESMFSIYMGPSNSSKHISLIQINSEESHDSSSNSFFSLPALPDDDDDQNSSSSSSSSSSIEEEEEEGVEMAKHDKETCPTDAARSSNASTTQFSEASSWNSKTSFAFPILAGKQGGRNESQDVITKAPPVLITTREKPQPYTIPDPINVNRGARWFCCCYPFRCPWFCLL